MRGALPLLSVTVRSIVPRGTVRSRHGRIYRHHVARRDRAGRPRPQGQASPEELVDEAIARVEAVNPQLDAVIRTRFDQARGRGGAAALPDGPFRGVPFLLKDLGAVWPASRRRSASARCAIGGDGR